MRSTSSARKGVAALLCVVLAAGTGCPAAIAGEPASPVLILAFHAPDVPEGTARARMDAISRQLLAALRVRRLAVPAQADPGGAQAEPHDADGTSLERIAAKLAEAARRMERMETGEAGLLLDAAEREARGFRLGEALRPYLAEIFLRRGLLRLWEGNRAGAEELFGRARALRPDFAPDPALFSPAVREAWARASARPPAGAEILVQSLPPGADILVDGSQAGTTPGRVRVPVLSRVVVRLSRPGYLAAERVGYWLPGDSEMFDMALTRDRMARLSELLADSGGGKEAGALLGEMASEAGAERVGIFVLSGRGPGARVRVLSLARGDEEPGAAGEFAWPEDAGEDGAGGAAELLVKAGWPVVPGASPRKSPWYHSWWFWALLGAAAVGIVAGAGGGGGSAGGSTGAIGVNF